MPLLKQLETFVAVCKLGSFVLVAKSQGIAPAMVGRRMDALEARLGAKLLLRTTRRITLTDEGALFLEECERILKELDEAQARVGLGNKVATGHLRVTAPAGFGRRHVATLVPKFQAENPQLRITLNLSDRLIDIESEAYDCAIRVGDLEDSRLVAVRLADNRRVCVATPEYLRRHGRPQSPEDLKKFNCLSLSSEGSQSRGWAFNENGRVIYQRPQGFLSCSDGQVLTDWCLQSLGIAWRSVWEVQQDIAHGRLESVLDAYAAPASGIYALYAKNQHLPLKVKLWLAFLRFHYAQTGYWTGYSI